MLKTAVQFQLILFLLVLVPFSGDSIASEREMNTETSLKRGSWFSQKFNRKTLRKYAEKMVARTITQEEMIDYISKGGSIDKLKSYNSSKNFFIGKSDYSILSLFLKQRYEHDESPVKDRLAILTMLLKVGANPNFTISDNDVSSTSHMSPILHAAATDDIEALTLFLKYSGNLELIEKNYLGNIGPALALANEVTTLDWLLANGANVHFKDSQDRTLLHLVADSNATIDKIKWLLSKGLSATEKDTYRKSPIQLVDDAILGWEQKIQSEEGQVFQGEDDKSMKTYFDGIRLNIAHLKTIKVLLTE